MGAPRCLRVGVWPQRIEAHITAVRSLVKQRRIMAAAVGGTTGAGRPRGETDSSPEHEMRQQEPAKRDQPFPGAA